MRVEIPSGGGSGRVASAPSSPIAGPVLQVVGPVYGGGLGRVASGPSSPSAPRVTAPPLAPMSTPSLRSGVDGERGQVALGSPSDDSAPSPSRGVRLSVRGMTGGQSPGNFTREEVIRFGGIPDQAAEGRRLSCRLQGRPEVDDMQQRCAVRAAKLLYVQVTTGMSVNTSNSILHFSNDEIVDNANQLGISLGSNEGEISNSINDLLDLEAERALDMIRNLAAVKPMNDSEIDALGVRVLDDFCADLAPPLPEPEEEDESVEMDVVGPPEMGSEDRVDARTGPKRKWKRKIYPMSTVRRSARIRTAKKFHDEI